MSESAAVLFDERGSEEVADSAGVRLADVRSDQLLWIDRCSGDAGGLAQSLGLELEHDVDRQLLARLDAASDRPPLVASDSSILVTLSLPPVGGGPAPFMRLRCLVGRNWVITVHDEESPALASFREYAQGAGEVGRLDGLSFLAALLEWVLAGYRDAFEAIESELEEFDLRALEGAFADPDQEVRGLVGLRQRVGRLRRELVRLRLVVTGLAHDELDRLSTPDSAARFETVALRLEETLQASHDCRDAVVASFDVIIARSDHRTNEIMKVLTLVTVLFLPGSFLAGLMGVNFRVGFFADGTYFWVLVGAIAAVGATTLVVARVRRWI